MKLRTNIFNRPRQRGVTLIECLVYVAVFPILLGIGLASFYFCWDHTRATIFTANQVETVLRAGEGWRADVRAATGPIAVKSTETGETVTIPENGKDVLYRFENGELRREIPAQNHSRLLLAKVKTSEMKAAARDNVRAWQWEVELTPPRAENRFPMLFTFEAAQAKP
ncbi:MAG TPA: prepilin-type N-terminal cleavage/methylation domain-containing protein [Verrucomicrobiae bacterium]|nr:prepilin-type N-terminal cleavage/methylation domain-containing protein [Verrucomicrobiae bacterium]